MRLVPALSILGALVTMFYELEVKSQAIDKPMAVWRCGNGSMCQNIVLAKTLYEPTPNYDEIIFQHPDVVFHMADINNHYAETDMSNITIILVHRKLGGDAFTWWVTYNLYNHVYDTRLRATYWLQPKANTLDDHTGLIPSVFAGFLGGPNGRVCGVQGLIIQNGSMPSVPFEQINAVDLIENPPQQQNGC